MDKGLIYSVLYKFICLLYLPSRISMCFRDSCKFENFVLTTVNQSLTMHHQSPKIHQTLFINIILQSHSRMCMYWWTPIKFKYQPQIGHKFCNLCHCSAAIFHFCCCKKFKC